ncbi:MAG TPA: HypC/HybG/HupF family hydrogenase formation chaperone [Patescibacteria group bacterium]|nr:HypC/HybG/HupF family hydrogenase formation chaperone [Patescibacteria group bacterium]
MCLATPVQVKKILNNFAVVEGGKKIDVSLVPNLHKGDYILVHADLGINKLEKEEALKIIALSAECHHQHPENHIAAGGVVHARE